METLTVNLSKLTLAKLKKLAESQKKSLSEFLEFLVEQGVNNL